jgi:hypothetical protein
MPEVTLTQVEQDVHGRTTRDKGKMKATTPSSPRDNGVRSCKTKPPSTKDILANIRNQRNRSGTPVLMARQNVSAATCYLTDILLMRVVIGFGYRVREWERVVRLQHARRRWRRVDSAISTFGRDRSAVATGHRPSG